MDGNEMAMALEQEGVDVSKMDQEEKSERGYIAGYNRRWKAVSDVLTEFSVEEFEAEVVWGEPIKKACVDLRTCTRKLYVNTEHYLQYRKSWKENGFSKDDFMKMKSYVFLGHVPDEFGDLLQSTIEAMESIARPKISL